MDKCVKKNAANAASAPKPQTTPPDFQSIFPGGITADALFDARTEKIVRCFADKLVRTGAFVQHEREDIEQEFRILLLRKMPAFDPTRSNRYVFAGMLLANAYKNALKARDRELKRTGGFLSLQDKPEGCDELLENVVTTDDYEQTVGGKLLPASRRGDYAEALAEFFSKLEDDNRRICNAIMKYGNAEQASLRIGIPARTILWRLKHTIRAKAVEAGLDEFCRGAR